MTDTMTLVSEGQRTVVGIELPKGKPQSPTRKVSFEIQGHEKFSPAGWIYADALGDIKIGDLVSYRIEKNADGFNKLTHIAPVDHNQRDQTADSAEAPKGSRDDAQGGSERPNSRVDRGAGLDDPAAPAERDVPNSDTARFEGWAFVANCGMVELAYEELADLKDAGDLEKLTPAMVHDVSYRLLDAADLAQRALVGRTDRAAQSHVRARGAVRTVLRSYPTGPLVGKGEEAWDEWRRSVTDAAVRLLKIAGSL